jgi:murein DD-endopeptidase MepM/ murein hydrolase activator NlpD
MSRSSASGEPPLALPKELLIPVAGVAPEDLVDTYSDARSEGRRHDAVDIMAPRGTPVVAAAEGTVLKLFKSEQGGTTLYQIDPDQRTLYYYAHLDRYASHIMEDVWIRQGETIGYVGDSGNAGAGNYHLHFEISTTHDPKQSWGGTPTNPYPLLRGTHGPN